jgi:hypothetical protein
LNVVHPLPRVDLAESADYPGAQLFDLAARLALFLGPVAFLACVVSEARAPQLHAAGNDILVYSASVVAQRQGNDRQSTFFDRQEAVLEQVLICDPNGPIRCDVVTTRCPNGHPSEEAH